MAHGDRVGFGRIGRRPCRAPCASGASYAVAAQCCSNSYRDPSRRDCGVRTAPRLAELPGVLRLANPAVVWPEVREYERCLVAGLSERLYIHHIANDRLFRRLRHRVAANGIRCADLYHCQQWRHAEPGYRTRTSDRHGVVRPRIRRRGVGSRRRGCRPDEAPDLRHGRNERRHLDLSVRRAGIYHHHLRR